MDDETIDVDALLGEERIRQLKRHNEKSFRNARILRARELRRSGMTLKEVGAALGVSRERARQILGLVLKL